MTMMKMNSMFHGNMYGMTGQDIPGRYIAWSMPTYIQYPKELTIQNDRFKHVNSEMDLRNLYHEFVMSGTLDSDVVAYMENDIVKQYTELLYSLRTSYNKGTVTKKDVEESNHKLYSEIAPNLTVNDDHSIHWSDNRIYVTPYSLGYLVSKRTDRYWSGHYPIFPLHKDALKMFSAWLINKVFECEEVEFIDVDRKVDDSIYNYSYSVN